MKRKLVLISFILVFAIPLISADGVDSKTIPLSSELYELIDDLYSLQGLARPSTGRPWSRAEAEIIVSRIAQNSLSPVEKKMYSRIQDIINESTRWTFPDWGFGVKLDLALEAYAHTNADSFVMDSDWLRGFENRLPLAKLAMDFSVGSLFYTYCDIQYGYGRVSMYDTFVSLNPDQTGGGVLSNDGYIGSYFMDPDAHMMVKSWLYSRPFATNIPKNSTYFDFIWPKRAVFSVGSKRWNLQIARDRIEIGNSTLGNMLVDNHTDFEDYFSLSFFSNGFKYQWTNLFLNGLTSPGEVVSDDVRIFMIHTLEFRPLANLSFIISEDVMFRIAAENGNSQVLDLSFFNPAFVWHNLNNRSMFNAIAYAEVNWAPLKGLEAYGQFALDQAQAPNEDHSQGDAWGLAAGAKYTVPIGDGIARFYAEFAYTAPLLYRRDKVDFVKLTRYFHLTTELEEQPVGDARRFYSNALVFEYIGFPYGGDAQALELGGVYSIPGMLKAKMFARLLQIGEFNLFVPHNEDRNNDDPPNYPGSTPTGTQWKRAIFLSSNVSFDMETLFSWPGVKLEAELDWIGKWNYASDTKTYSDGKTDTQFSLSVNVSF